MRSSVVIAFLCGLVLGGVVGVGGAGIVFLPAQFQVQQEQFRLHELEQEMVSQRVTDEEALQNAVKQRQQSEARRKQLEIENKQLKLQLEDATRQLGEAQQKLYKRP
jgi:uncharacterized protein HemX